MKRNKYKDYLWYTAIAANTVCRAINNAAATIDLMLLNSFAENAKFLNKIDIKKPPLQ